MLKFYIVVLILTLLPACNLQSISTQLPPAIASPIATDTNDEADGWETISDGLEWRIYVPDSGELVQLYVIRIALEKFRFRALYREGDPLRINDWQAIEPDADVIINANFFDPDNNVIGLLVSDGVVYGQASQNRGGIFAVQDGVASVRSNQTQPYQGEALEQAVQASPFLVENREQAYFQTASSQLSRRTIIAQDIDGNILIMATPLLGLSLFDLSAYLPTTDLNIVNALNLDGGGSTMMTVPSADLLIPSLDAVPSILAVYAR